MSKRENARTPFRLYGARVPVFIACKSNSVQIYTRTINTETVGQFQAKDSPVTLLSILYCYGSALARAALTLIRLGLANLGYLSMRCFMFPTSFLSFV